MGNIPPRTPPAPAPPPRVTYSCKGGRVPGSFITLPPSKAVAPPPRPPRGGSGVPGVKRCLYCRS